MLAIMQNHSQPLVSVCIGTYNRADLIRECLDSVLAQTYCPIEVVVADNASTDATLDLVRAHSVGARVERRIENSGLCSTTRNLAVRKARGRYIAFLDSDDAWEPAKLERQVAFLETHPDIPLCHTVVRVMDERSRIYGIRHEGRLPPTGDCFDALLEHCWITISSVMIRRELYDECGPFSEELPYGKLGEDYEFFLKVAARYPIGVIEEPLVRYRKSAASITHGNWRATPKAVPFLMALLDRAEVWSKRMSSTDLRLMVAAAAGENAHYWGQQGYPLRAAWGALQALRLNALALAPWRALLVEMARGAYGSFRRRMRT